MPFLSSLNVEAELSYAYIHAVAAMAKMGCQVTDRHLDNAGVDATVSARDQFAPDSIFTDISLHIQLKATTKPATLNARQQYPYFMEDTRRYDRLREARAVPTRVLVVLFLPPMSAAWLDWTEQQLVMQRCAYWTSLLDAPASANATGQTVYLPQLQPFSPDGLQTLFTRLSRAERLIYAP